MRRFLLTLILSALAFAGSVYAQSNMDVITLSKFTNYTPGANKWFNDMTFGSGATYSGHIKVAGDESGLVFDKKSDAFYVVKPVEDARIKSVAITFLTNGELEIYLSNTRQLSMSGGSDVTKMTISTTNPVINFTDDYKYFIFRNAGNEVIVSMITVVWEIQGLVANVDVPTLLVEGVEYDPATPLDLGGEEKHITFTHSSPDATIYYLWEPDNEPGLPLYTPYSEELVITKPGTLSYNCEVGGQESDVVELKIIGEEVNAIAEIEADSAAKSEWFDLQGRKVTAPTHGVYILRSGNKIQKIIK